MPNPTTLTGKLMAALDEILDTLSNGKMSVNITSISDPEGIDVRITNTTSEPLPVVIQNVDNTIDLDVRIAETIEIDTSTPLDVQLNNLDSNNKLPVVIDSLPEVSIDTTTPLDVNSTIQNSSIVTRPEVYDGSAWQERSGDSDGRAINKDQKYYSDADITALGSSSNVNVWTTALADGILNYQYVQTYDYEYPSVTYYTHPNLGDNNKCLKEVISYYSTLDAYVERSRFYKLEDWTFDNTIKGSVSISNSTPVTVSSTDAANTIVSDITWSSSTTGLAEITLTGTDASEYQLFVTRGVNTFYTSGFNPLSGDIVKLTRNTPTDTYNHNVTVSIVGSVYGVSDSVNINMTN